MSCLGGRDTLSRLGSLLLDLSSRVRALMCSALCLRIRYRGLIQVMYLALVPLNLFRQ